MRQITLSNKPLRGIPRRIRALERWASSFRDEFYPRSEHKERYTHWKIPVHEALVQGPQARIEVQVLCIQQLLEAASHLSEKKENKGEGDRFYFHPRC
jgi:hypothetical protein